MRTQLAAALLLLVGLLQMVGDLTGVTAIKGLGAATVASPAPKVFSAVRGFETYSNRFSIRWKDTHGVAHDEELTSERYAHVRGPYNRRNVFGAALAYGPVLPPELRDPVLRYAACGQRPLLRELGFDVDAMVDPIRVRYAPRWDVEGAHATSVTACPSAKAATARVLFLGNSFVYVNDLPGLLRSIAEEDGLDLEVASHAPGGAKLWQHAQSDEVRQLLQRRWDFVVLQEQSQLPSLAEERETTTAPALGALRDLAVRGGSKPVLYATWGYRKGDPDNAAPGDSYEEMQRRLDDGFAALSERQGVPIVPVNRAWAKAHATHPNWELWSGDGRHPSMEGSYLAACVFYAALFHRSPSRNAFTAGLSPEIAQGLQDIAASVAPP